MTSNNRAVLSQISALETLAQRKPEEANKINETILRLRQRFCLIPSVRLEITPSRPGRPIYTNSKGDNLKHAVVSDKPDNLGNYLVKNANR